MKKRIPVALNDAQYNDISNAAEHYGLTLSAFMCMASREKADRVNSIQEARPYISNNVVSAPINGKEG